MSTPEQEPECCRRARENERERAAEIVARHIGSVDPLTAAMLRRIINLIRRSE